MAGRDGTGGAAQQLRRRGVLGQPGAHRVANQARRVHQNLASPLVRVEARQAVLVQRLNRHPRL